jgi:alpha-glucosidase
VITGAGTTTGDFAVGGGSGVSHEFVRDNGVTQFGQSIYVVGSIDALGQWDPTRAVKLEPTAYPRWTAKIDNLPASTPIDWKCIKRPETGDTGNVLAWEPDPNNRFTSTASGTGAPTFGNFQP